MKKVLFISSTGGHLTQLLQLKPLFNKYYSIIVTEKTPVSMNFKDKFEHVEYLVYGTRQQLLKYSFIFPYNILKSLIIYIKYRPKVIITTGAHTAVPICYIGKLFGSKIVYIESFSKSHSKTLSGRIIYPIADLFLVQWESMLEIYPKALYKGTLY